MTLKCAWTWLPKKKRPRGRAPHGSNGVPARWDTAVGWCDDLSADDTPPAQEHVDADADANLAGVNVEFVKALTAERDQANQKVLNLQQEIKSLQEAAERGRLKAAEDTKILQLMAIARRPDMGTSTLSSPKSGDSAIGAALAFLGSRSSDIYLITSDA